MVQGLTVLTSTTIGSRDLWWLDDPLATQGYQVWRAYDYPAQSNWTLLTPTPQPGHFYRDATQLKLFTYTPKPSDMLFRGRDGWGIRIPDVPYSAVVSGRAALASSPDDVTVTYDSVAWRVLRVDPLDHTIWLDQSSYLSANGAVDLSQNPDPATVAQFSVTYYQLANHVDIYSNLTRCWYAVVSVGSAGPLNNPWDNGIGTVNTFEVDRMDYLQAEMVRRNTWIFENVGEPALLMLRRTRGQRCACTENGSRQPNPACSSCYEIGIVGGYYGPYDIFFVDPDTATTRLLNEGGVKVERQSRSYLGPTPIVQDGDLIARRNGDRLVISHVTYKSPRGVLLQQDFDVTLLPPGDTRYLIPIDTPKTDSNGNPLWPAIYNPAVEDDPLNGQGGAEPIATALPPLWQAATNYQSGMIVWDSNGNIQTCTQPGISGTTVPTWNTAMGGLTTDGAVVWQNGGRSPLADKQPWLNQAVQIGRSSVFSDLEQ